MLQLRYHRVKSDLLIEYAIYQTQILNSSSMTTQFEPAETRILGLPDDKIPEFSRALSMWMELDAPDWNIWLKPDSLPPQLISPFKEYIQFYYDELLPYMLDFHGGGTDGDSLFGEYGLCKFVDKNYAFVAISLTKNCLEVNLPARHRAGLLRDGQNRIIQVAVRSMAEELRMMMRLRCNGRDIKHACERNVLLMFRFLSIMRSERMETLVLRYLDEDEVDLEVVRGMLEIDEARYRYTVGMTRYD
ncbi:hypothetical protein BJ508DRAFT_371495 [Ascobolus immersus RN42]|uniref:Uncharacterized protein n=1 Tax=Ascobolus immersus RN42 TaxID=1160509 RepID=A0A3N4IUW7_ASCIM|nr:hypothetical protein BJ508DRAFT_371495 [Ascobolus immersus RN42]